MKKLSIVIFISGLVILLHSCQSPWQELFNGENLEGWDVWCGPLEKDGTAPGLNQDPLNLFSVVEEEGAKVLRISGEVNASIASKEEFENYHLSMEFKWGDEVFANRNSGLLYHSYGDFGVGLGVWKSSHELQLMTGNIGDSYRMGNSYCEIPMIKKEDGKFGYSKGAEKQPSIPGTDTRIIAKDGNYENAIGEWNTIELYCFEGTSVHVVNGKVNMINYNSSKYADGKSDPLTKGHIQIQSEGGELFVRSIKVKPIKEIPAELLN